jgi:hypothetical protein
MKNEEYTKIKKSNKTSSLDYIRIMVCRKSGKIKKEKSKEIIAEI